jgi:hypothetical protein
MAQTPGSGSGRARGADTAGRRQELLPVDEDEDAAQDHRERLEADDGDEDEEEGLEDVEAGSPPKLPLPSRIDHDRRT